MAEKANSTKVIKVRDCFIMKCVENDATKVENNLWLEWFVKKKVGPTGVLSVLHIEILGFLNHFTSTVVLPTMFTGRLMPCSFMVMEILDLVAL